MRGHIQVLLSILSVNLTSTDNFREFLVKKPIFVLWRKGDCVTFSLECVLVIFFKVSRIAHYVVINTSLVFSFFFFYATIEIKKVTVKYDSNQFDDLK